MREIRQKAGMKKDRCKGGLSGLCRTGNGHTAAEIPVWFPGLIP